MRKSETVKLADRDIVVSEVRVKKMLRLLPVGDLVGNDGGSAMEKTFKEHAEELLQEACGLKLADLSELYPSEVEDIWNAFKRVNSFLFQTAGWLGATEQIKRLVVSVLDSVGREFADSLNADIRTALNTAMAALSTPSSSASGLGESA